MNNEQLFELRHRDACFDCGGDVVVSPRTNPDGVCLNCGPVGIDALQKDGEWVEGYSLQSWAGHLDDVKNRPANWFEPTDDEVSF